MTAVRAEGRRLLTEDDAAAEAGVDIEAIRRWRALGLLEPVRTMRGLRYPQDALQALLETAWKAWKAPEPAAGHLTPQQASLILRVRTPTLATKAREGRLTTVATATGARRYLADEIHAIAGRRRDPRFSQWWPEPKLPDLPR